MKRIFTYLITFLLVTIGWTSLHAQPTYEKTPMEPIPMRSTQAMPTYGKYGTTYAPFSTSVPSEQSAVSTNGSSVPKGGIKRGGNFNHGTEYGQSEESPIGEPWILAFFAILFAGVIAVRNRKNTLTNEK